MKRKGKQLREQNLHCKLHQFTVTWCKYLKGHFSSVEKWMTWTNMFRKLLWVCLGNVIQPRDNLQAWKDNTKFYVYLLSRNKQYKNFDNIMHGLALE